MVADQVAHPAHLNARDTTLAFVSRAPQADIERLKARMGWEVIPWYTLTDDFDADFGVDEWHGTNAFLRDDEDRIFRTYFVDSRGDEVMGGTWSYLDITALGRQEEWEDSPEGYPQTPPYEWWKRHDEYDGSASRLPPRTPSRSSARVAARREERALVIAHVGGVPVEEILPSVTGAGAGLLRRARLADAAPATPTGAAEMTDDQDAAHGAHLPGARRGGLRRVDERGGAAPLVARRARLGDDRGRGRPARRRRRCGWSCATPTRTSSTAAAARYTEVEPPTRLAFTWIWDDDPQADADRDRLRGERGVTTVRFTHSGLWDEEAVRSHEDGWGKLFDNLERELETARG